MKQIVLLSLESLLNLEYLYALIFTVKNNPLFPDVSSDEYRDY